MQHFGKALRDLIRSRHFNAKTFAKHAKLGEATVYKQLNHPERIVSLATYIIIADALGMTADELDARWMSIPPAPVAPSPPKPEELWLHVEWFRKLEAADQQVALGAFEAARRPAAKPKISKAG